MAIKNMATLFDSPQGVNGGVTQAPAAVNQPKQRTGPKVVHQCIDPFGEPDSREKYFYQKFRAKVEKLPRRSQAVVNNLVLCCGMVGSIDDARDVMATLRSFFNATLAEQSDYQKHCGR